MNGLFKIIVSLSLSGSVLIIALLVCGRALRHRLSKRWQYYVWIIVLARLLLPFTPEGSLVGSLFQSMDRAAIWSAPAAPGYTTAPAPQQGEGAPFPASSAGEPAHLVPVPQVWLVWLAGALFLLTRKILTYQSYVRCVRAGCTVVSDPALLERLARLREQAGVKAPVELTTNSLLFSPVLIGFFRPSIVLPCTGQADADFEYTVLHELTHCKRRDLCYKWLVQLVLCIHWFNPLVYWMNREISRACELSCDEAVIRALDTPGRRAYGDTLLRASRAGNGCGASPASMALGESGGLLKERLEAIMKFHKKSGLAAGAAVLLTLALCFGATAMGAYAMDGGAKGRADGTTAASAQEEKTQYTSRTESLVEKFKRYEPFDVRYSAENDAVYYNGERVKLFVEFKADKVEEAIGYAFELCYRDASGGTLALEAVRDENGTVTGIRQLNGAITAELLEDLDLQADVPEGGTVVQANDMAPNDYIVMDGTQTLVSYGITARDLTKENANRAIKEWIGRCDQRVSMYTRRERSDSGCTTYIYYNGGGRYPWSMEADGSGAQINLFSGSPLVTDDGYFLLCFTSPDKVAFRLNLDGVELGDA